MAVGDAATEVPSKAGTAEQDDGEELTITSIAALERLYPAAGGAALTKVVPQLTPAYRTHIAAAPFVALATAGPGGLDCSPRGDRGSVVTIADDRTLLIADRPGNNRLDSLRNIVHDDRIGLLFLTPGLDMTVRVNGSATLSVAPHLLDRLAIDGKRPRLVIVVSIHEVYAQCSRALLRARMWEPEGRVDADSLPKMGEILREIEASFDAEEFDREWPQRARQALW
ncbi:pyridoxamine 5'-phosphate oxidase family protein [Pseudohoeflea coraliihabitans]|uniref:Pyridoxamine 5'-phosphate oxidase family protein n=1 Tax=Pseudohoeflea coraliihabitans TaxID=2860393 RepID=A0ABS6WPX6_9HYPH|nr:pyridoxamine 5'-phosphate oxidase family protein [Pseudohoeflea sp. DP4N28-3]MBW3098017.1 pyridoxamine 5'-phosphate oxidase family protein [Pseudohoeflea sp. DP4N28-3]